MQQTTDGLLAWPTEGQLRLAVPVNDEAIRIHSNVGVVGAVDDEAGACDVGLGEVLGLAQGIFHLLALGNVARDTAGADDGAVAVAQRQFRGRNPVDAAIRPIFGFLARYQRLAGANHFLFIEISLLGVCRAEEIEVGLANGLGGSDRPKRWARARLMRIKRLSRSLK